MNDAEEEVIISHVYLCVPIASIQMTAMAQGNYTEAFAQRSLLQRGVSTHRSFYTQKLLHKGSVCLHTDSFAHRSFCRQKYLHTEAFTRRSFHTEELLHTEAFTHRSLYAQTFLHRDAFYKEELLTQKFLHREAFT